MFYVAFGPNKQDFHSLRETFILNLTRFSETGFQCFSLISSWGSSLLEALAGTTCSTTKLSSAQSAQSVATKMTTWRQGNDKGKPHNCALMIFSNYMIWVKILKFDRLPFHQEYLPSLGSKQSQRAITLLLTRRGPSYCFPSPHPHCGHTDILNMWKRFMWKMYTFSSAYMWRKEKLAKLEFFCTTKYFYLRLIFNFHFVIKGPLPYMETQAHFHSLNFLWQIFKSELRQS